MGLPSAMVSTPLTSTRTTPMASAMSRGLPPGQVVDQRGRLGADRLGVEDEQVGAQSFGDPAPVVQPEQLGRGLGHHLDGPLQGTSLRLRRQSPRNEVG